MKFTDPRLYIQGIGIAMMTDPATGNVLYWDDKFQDGNITAQADNGEIDAGIGNATAILIPHTSKVNVNVSSAAYSAYIRAAAVGANIGSGAPVMVCTTIKATGTSLTIGLTEGTPVAGLGDTEAVCYVQEMDAAGTIAATGTAYPISAAGVISNFVATNNKTYVVTYYANRANARLTTVTSNMKGKVVRFILQRPIYTNVNPVTKSGDLWGYHYDIIPALQLLPDSAGMSGSQTAATNTAITGMAVMYDDEVITGDDCGGCALRGNPLWYQLDVPCDTTQDIVGLALIGGVITVPVSSTYTIDDFDLIVGNTRVSPDPAKMTYELDSAPSGTSVAGAVITAGSTAGDCEITATYTDGGSTWTAVGNLSVVQPGT